MSLRRLSMLLACFATSHAVADFEKGLPKDDSIAKDWLAKAARRGFEPATGPFLEVRKVEGGRLGFIGQVEGLRWAFIVPGSEIVGAPGQPLMTVDGTLLQVRATSKKHFADDPGPLLDAYRRWEQKHQRENFADASFGPNSMCKGDRVGYREWTTTFAANAKWKYQVYVGFEIGPTSVLSINSAYGTEEEKEKVARAIGEVCRTFTSDW